LIQQKSSNGITSGIITGIEALSRFGMGKRTTQDIIKIQLKLISSFWLLSYIGLRLTKQKYVPMQEPRHKQIENN
jgi:preprotein translocase subunit SecG